MGRRTVGDARLQQGRSGRRGGRDDDELRGGRRVAPQVRRRPTRRRRGQGGTCDLGASRRRRPAAARGAGDGVHAAERKTLAPDGLAGRSRRRHGTLARPAGVAGAVLGLGQARPALESRPRTSRPGGHRPPGPLGGQEADLLPPHLPPRGRSGASGALQGPPQAPERPDPRLAVQSALLEPRSGLSDRPGPARLRPQPGGALRRLDSRGFGGHPARSGGRRTGRLALHPPGLLQIWLPDRRPPEVRPHDGLGRGLHAARRGRLGAPDLGRGAGLGAPRGRPGRTPAPARHGDPWRRVRHDVDGQGAGRRLRRRHPQARAGSGGGTGGVLALPLARLLRHLRFQHAGHAPAVRSHG